MQLEIKEKGSKAFYTETVNVVSQYRALLKKPDRKLKDNFRIFRLYIIICSVMLALNGLMWYFWGTDSASLAVFAMLVICIVMCGAFLYSMTKMRNAMMSDGRSSVLTLDESGVELNKGGSQIVRFSWDDVAFARVFKESIAFISKDRSGMVISVDRRYLDAIMDYLDDHPAGIKMIS